VRNTGGRNKSRTEDHAFASLFMTRDRSLRLTSQKTIIGEKKEVETGFPGYGSLVNVL